MLSAGFYDAYYNRARKVRALIKRDFEQAFAAGVDAILTPATPPSSAWGIGEKGAADPVEMYLEDIFTVTLNLAGLPGVAVPVGLDSKGLPMGLQLIGRPWRRATFSITRLFWSKRQVFRQNRRNGGKTRGPRRCGGLFRTGPVRGSVNMRCGYDEV